MSQTSCARLVKVFVVVALCGVDSPINLSVCVGFGYRVVRGSFSLISLINWMSAFCSLWWPLKASISSFFVNGGKSAVNVT